jgi:hypothetical protein
VDVSACLQRSAIRLEHGTGCAADTSAMATSWPAWPTRDRACLRARRATLIDGPAQLPEAACIPSSTRSSSKSCGMVGDGWCHVHGACLPFRVRQRVLRTLPAGSRLRHSARIEFYREQSGATCGWAVSTPSATTVIPRPWASRMIAARSRSRPEPASLRSRPRVSVSCAAWQHGENRGADIVLPRMVPHRWCCLAGLGWRAVDT